MRISVVIVGIHYIEPIILEVLMVFLKPIAIPINSGSVFAARLVVVGTRLNRFGSSDGVGMSQQHLGITMSERTWCREFFEETKFWRQAKGLIPLDYLSGPFPRRLFGMYKPPWIDRFLSVLSFLAPLTAGAFRAV